MDNFLLMYLGETALSVFVHIFILLSCLEQERVDKRAHSFIVMQKRL